MLKKLGLFLSGLLIILLGFNCFIYTHNYLPYKSGDLPVINYVIIRESYIDRNYIEQEIKNLLKADYEYIETNFKDPKTLGQANIYTKRIEIRPNLSLENYTWTLMHEYIHIKDFTICERYCNFKGFKILYESNIDYFHNLAIAYIELEREGYVSYEYSCIGYIEEYLNDRDNIN